MKFWKNKRILSFILVLVMISSYGMVASGTTTEELQNQKSSAVNTKDEIQKKIDELELQLQQLGKDTKDIESYIATIDKQMQDFNNSIYNLNNQIEQKQTEIKNNQALLEQTKQDLKQQYDSMKLRIQYMYEHQNENYIAILMQSSDMADMLNKAEYINKITDYDREALMKYAETEKKIQDTQVALENDQKQLEDSLASVEVQKEQMKLIQNAKNAQLELLKQNTAQVNSAKTQSEKDKAEQEDAIRKIETKIAANVPASTSAISTSNSGTSTPYTGKFAWPVPASHRITSVWGEVVDRSSPHNGVDIGASTPKVDGDQILAAESGQVVIADYSTSAGNWIWIYHGGGVYTVYMHTSKMLVSVGQNVEKGQLIALMGNTGNSTGTHLHFGVRVNGVYVDPNAYINYKQYIK